MRRAAVIGLGLLIIMLPAGFAYSGSRPGPVSAAVMTLRFEPQSGKFSGRLSTLPPHRFCDKHRRIVIKHLGGEVVAQTRTNKVGHYAVRTEETGRGPWFAKAKRVDRRHVRCSGANAVAD